MADKLDDVLSGALGYFWTHSGPITMASESAKGYLRSSDRALVQVELLYELDTKKSLVGRAEDLFDSRPSPHSMTAITQYGGVLLLDHVGRGYTVTIAGPRASVERHSFDAIAIDVSVTKLNSHKTTGVSASFSNVLSWAGFTSVIEDFTMRENRVRSVTISAVNSDGYSASLDRRRRLHLRPSWKVSGPREARTVHSLLHLECTSETPVVFSTLLLPILQFQDLLSLALDGPPLVNQAAIALQYRDRSEKVPFWSRELGGYGAPSAAPFKASPAPYFTFSDIGGLGGVSSWMNLYRRYPRFVAPIARNWRLGERSVETSLLEVATTIEYAVAAARKTRRPKWATEGCPSIALALHAGQGFSEWVEDARKWGGLFWETYNRLKHDPAMVDPLVMHRMAQSGRILAIVIMLNRVSRGKIAAVRLLSDTRLEPIRDGVRSMVGQYTPTASKRRGKR